MVNHVCRNVERENMRIGPFGLWETLVILLVLLLLFGASRLPALAKGLGQSIKEFRGAIKEPAIKESKRGETNDDETSKTTRADRDSTPLVNERIPS
jgi:sec-independent protein translocase protein TatA